MLPCLYCGLDVRMSVGEQHDHVAACRAIDRREQIQPTVRCNLCDGRADVVTVLTSEAGCPGTTTYFVCPFCDRTRCGFCGWIDLSGLVRTCRCGRGLGIWHDQRGVA